MKKIILFLTMLVGGLTAQAEDYTYLTFETTDGAKTSVDVSSLPVTINLDNSTLTIGNQRCCRPEKSHVVAQEGCKEREGRKRHPRQNPQRCR